MNSSSDSLLWLEMWLKLLTNSIVSEFAGSGGALPSIIEAPSEMAGKSCNIITLEDWSFFFRRPRQATADLLTEVGCYFQCNSFPFMGAFKSTFSQEYKHLCI